MMRSSYTGQRLLNNKASGPNGLNLDFQFRLVNILPDSPGARIQCSLEAVTLGTSKGDYNALSYHWGEVNSAKKIELDGELFPVRENLHLALQHIRHTTERRRFFIDALCINQKDNDEKSCQVQSMWAIYKFAKHAVVFLGKEHPSTPKVFQWINAVGEWLPSAQEEMVKGMVASPSVPSFQDQLLIYKGLADLLSRRWWRQAKSTVP
jgi:hypothetical protein